LRRCRGTLASTDVPNAADACAGVESDLSDASRTSASPAPMARPSRIPSTVSERGRGLTGVDGVVASSITRASTAPALPASSSAIFSINSAETALAMSRALIGSVSVALMSTSNVSGSGLAVTLARISPAVNWPSSRSDAPSATARDPAMRV
jgi:hypothetical protein